MARASKGEQGRARGGRCRGHGTEEEVRGLLLFLVEEVLPDDPEGEGGEMGRGKKIVYRLVAA
jgi:hypothetical protein